MHVLLHHLNVGNNHAETQSYASQCLSDRDNQTPGSAGNGRVCPEAPDRFYVGRSGSHGFRCIEALSEVVPLFRSRIRYTKDKLEASAEEKKSIFEYSPNCGFARDLVHFFQELMAGGED